MPKNFKHRPLYAQNLPDNVRKPKIKWKILPTLWAGVKRVALALGFLTLFQLVLIFAILLPAGMQPSVPELPKKNIVLYWSFEDPLSEVYAPAGFADAFEDPVMTVRETISLLNKAAKDERVKGIVARMKSAQVSMVHAEELRQALLNFKQSGKFAYVYSTSYGEGSSGLGNYYLISTFDEIWMQPMGIVSLNGLNAEMLFMRGLLNKIGITPNFFQRKEYKSAYENFTRSSMSDANEETYKRLIGDLREEVLKVIPQQIGMEPEAFEALVNKGLFTTAEAEEAGLIHMSVILMS